MGRPRSWVMAKEDAGSGSWKIFLTFFKQNRGGMGMFFPMNGVLKMSVSCKVSNFIHLLDLVLIILILLRGPRLDAAYAFP